MCSTKTEEFIKNRRSADQVPGKEVRVALEQQKLNK
jgi:hypothetical protein